MDGMKAEEVKVSLRSYSSLFTPKTVYYCLLEITILRAQDLGSFS